MKSKRIEREFISVENDKSILLKIFLREHQVGKKKANKRRRSLVSINMWIVGT